MLVSSKLSWVYGAIVTVPSVPLVIKYGGFFTLIPFFLFVNYLVNYVFALVPKFKIKYLSLIVLIFLFIAAVLLLIVYPYADNQSSFGRGSDRDDAIKLGIDAILRGSDPYLEKTYFGNSISNLPGTFLLYLPVYAITQSTLFTQIFMIALSLLFLNGYNKRVSTGTVFLLSISPWFWQDWLTGGDFVITSLLAISCLTVYLGKNKANPWLIVLLGVILGILAFTRITNACIILIGFLIFENRRNLTPLKIVLPLLTLAFLICVVISNNWGIRSALQVQESKSTPFASLLIGLAIVSITIFFIYQALKLEEVVLFLSSLGLIFSVPAFLFSGNLNLLNYGAFSVPFLALKFKRDQMIIKKK